MILSLFEIAIIWHPTGSQIKEGQSSKLLMPPTFVLAKNQQTAEMQQVMELDKQYKDQLDQIKIHCRPF